MSTRFCRDEFCAASFTPRNGGHVYCEKCSTQSARNKRYIRKYRARVKVRRLVRLQSRKHWPARRDSVNLRKRLDYAAHKEEISAIRKIKRYA